ncbi:hypothetical protein BZG36_00660 [Bifiguratus adelaidae]|uniref:NodB homology domain-containing protein n=1 Tax=Bifiguratus adelaidae TaxID=1938954 RepID=A0A261Y708_9FUNG|nr:hypothetical protein BZG36_00660 [Bifiguratus adelaidae]
MRVPFYIATYSFVASQLSAIAAQDVSAQGAPSNNDPPSSIASCLTQGQVALTYSEGPSDVTSQILNTLKAANARASFFVNATWLYTQQYAQMLQRTYNEGHYIGMSYRVPNDDSSLYTNDQLAADLNANTDAIQGLIGVAPKYIRLHANGAPDAKMQGIVASQGYQLVTYNLDSQDYSFDASSASGIVNVYKTTFQNQSDIFNVKGAYISIQYDIPSTGSAAALGSIINTINQYGYTMVRMDGCVNDKSPYRQNATANSPSVSDKFSFGTSGYVQGQSSVSSSGSNSGSGGSSSSSSKSGATTVQISLATLGMGAIAALAFSLFQG